ncbi:2-phospho-L-lactate guanylyltransferase [Candidatus Bathyarchaeota archaeon]|nr:MAG: 2-phospho-L-lactate guanylyltransferase [Candidatus Bathyarchaeota archaeon]
MNDNWAVIPVKGLTESKTRLSTSLQGDKRRILVEALLEDVLSSIIRSRVYGTVMLISPDENVGSRFRSHEVFFLKQIGPGLNRAIEQANRLATQKHARSLTTVLADIPLVEAGDFKELLSLGPAARKVVMAPSFKAGTNVMLASPPGVISPSYGRWSYSKHLRLAQLKRVDAYSISNSRISFDIDTVSDLMELRRRDPESKTASGRAAEMLKLVPSQPRIH